jgi:hypothetical protein
MFEHIGFTGTREGMTPEQKFYLCGLLSFLANNIDTVHHGDCIGADKDFHNLVREFCPLATIHIHPPSNPKTRAFCQGDIVHPEKPYMERNQDIIDACSLLLSTPKDIEKPSNLKGQGTWATISRAEKQGKQITIVYPLGSFDSLNGPVL